MSKAARRFIAGLLLGAGLHDILKAEEGKPKPQAPIEAAAPKKDDVGETPGKIGDVILHAKPQPPEPQEPPGQLVYYCSKCGFPAGEDDPSCDFCGSTSIDSKREETKPSHKERKNQGAKKEQGSKQETHDEDYDSIYCPKCTARLENICHHYRCPNCDTYCGNCGSIVKNFAKRCPFCGEEFEKKRIFIQA